MVVRPKMDTLCRRRRLHREYVGVEESKKPRAVIRRRCEARREQPAKQETVRPCRVGQVGMGNIVQTLSPSRRSLGSRSLAWQGLEL